MTRSGKLTVQFCICGVLLACLAGDLFVVHGPVCRMVEGLRAGGSGEIAATKADVVVAKVCGKPITRRQLDRAVCERLWLGGQSMDDLTPETRRSAKSTALDQLIDHELLSIRMKTVGREIPVSDRELDERMRLFRSRFESGDAMMAAIKSQGIGGEADLRIRFLAQIRQEKHVASEITQVAAVTDVEARDWFDRHRKELAIPERVEARHVFIPTLDHPAKDAEAKLAAALDELNAGRKDFAGLAKGLSEDPATREQGGYLGWMTRQRVPVDFSNAVFALATKRPTLVRSRLGWHLVEVLARKPSELQSFEQAKPEIVAAMETIKRSRAIREFRAALRKSHEPEIEVFHDRVGE